MRLIDADALESKMEQNLWGKEWDKALALQMVRDAPTIDAVEVVRCRDCKHWDNEDDAQRCSYTHNGLHWAKPDDFCSYGERREQ